MKKITVCLLAVISALAVGGCGSVAEEPAETNTDSEAVKPVVMENTAEVSESAEFKCYHDDYPGERFDIAEDKLEEFTECYENIRESWEVVSESPSEAYSGVYTGLHYGVEISEGDNKAYRLTLITNLQVERDVEFEYGEMLFYDKEQDVISWVRCDIDMYTELYEIVSGSVCYANASVN